MLLTVKEFTNLATNEMPGLVSKLQESTGRFGVEEERAWSASLGKVARILDAADLGAFHVQIAAPSGNVSLEYRLPAASSWCDLVLLGRGCARPAAVVVELKNWDTRRDRPGPRPGIIIHNDAETLHPSEQVRGYVEYCRRFHSTVQDRGASVAGCALLTASDKAAAYVASPHDTLTQDYPVFTTSSAQAGAQFPGFIREHLLEPDAAFARDFEAGIYKQDRNFVRAVAEALLDPDKAGFVLLDGQRLGYERCLQAVDQLLKAGDGSKTVILIEGPPGSGKSVLAARLWAELALDDRIRGDVVFTTTSGAQKSNWKAIYDRIADDRAGSGLVIGANQFNPGLTTRWVAQQRQLGRKVTIGRWRENLALWRKQLGDGRIHDDQMAVTVVDEAHALIDPTVPGTEGIPPSGWVHLAGPQAWHIIRASKLSIFLLDPEQSYRDNETTTGESIRRFAEDHGAGVLPTLSLGDSQFRCLGSKEYVDWVDAFLSQSPERMAATPWRAGNGRPGFQFELADDPAALEERLRAHVDVGRSARFVAAYGRPWRTKGILKPHSLPPDEKDFLVRYERGGKLRTWTRIWNFAPEQDYTLFVQAPERSAMRKDPLCEVGCPYVVRGFDFDYVGLLWLSDLVWRKDRWVAQMAHIHESAWKKTIAAAKKESRAATHGPKTADLVRRLLRGYRILLTRAIRGVYVWCEDPETKEHLTRGLETVNRDR